MGSINLYSDFITQSWCGIAEHFDDGNGGCCGGYEF